MKYLFLIFSLTFCYTSHADWQTELKKVDYLIDSISKLEATFVRNGKDHSPKEAADHLRMKFNRATNSWFAPKKEKWTAKMFIEKIASKSSLSGKPYTIRFQDGTTVTSKSWLSEQLGKWTETKQTSP